MDLDDIPQEPTLHEKVEKYDVIWIAVPFSRKELLGPPARKGLCFGLGALSSDGVAWQELRASLALGEKPTGFAKGSHFAFHQGPRPWLTRTSEEDDDVRQEMPVAVAPWLT